MFQGRLKCVLKTFEDVSWIFQISSKGVSCVKELSNVFQGSFKGISRDFRVFLESFKGVSMKIQG